MCNSAFVPRRRGRRANVSQSVYDFNPSYIRFNNRLRSFIPSEYQIHSRLSTDFFLAGLQDRVELQRPLKPLQPLFEYRRRRRLSIGQFPDALIRQGCDFFCTQGLVVDADIVNHTGEESPCIKVFRGTYVQAAIRRHAGNERRIFSY